MRRQNYDLIVDLQNNPISRLIRQKTHCRAWSEFDVLSPIPHGERVRQTIDAVWPIGAQLDCAFELRNPQLGLELVDPADRKRELVVLNPAGFYKTRHWPIENYVEFARLWQRHENPNARFLLLGLPRIREQANYIQRQLPESTINLVEQTSVAQAFSILQNVRFVLSEDSGLLHMAWCSGIPNLALLGSSRSDWTRPLGPHSTFLGSGDLACGQCMQPECRFGDVRCLTRYNAEYVFGLARELLRRCA
jgi:ADP-heptose:LPS heptosyltransferase